MSDEPVVVFNSSGMVVYSQLMLCKAAECQVAGLYRATPLREHRAVLDGRTQEGGLNPF